MKSFPIAALVAGASLLALSQTALAQTGAPTPQARPVAQTNVQLVRSHPVHRRAAYTRLARVQAVDFAPSCARFACGRMILLGVAY